MRGLWAAVVFVMPRMAGAFGGDESLKVFSPGRVVESRHFRVAHETPFAPAQVLTTLEGLHARLTLDLAAFAPDLSREKIQVYIFKDSDSYVAHTGMPSWAVAHVHVGLKTIYGHPSESWTRVLAHELGHLFFTQYFLARSTTPPVWLNEGVATLMEWDYGMAADHMGVEALLRRRGAVPLDQFFASTYKGAGEGDGEAVSLWYAQAHSVTRYLFREFTRGQFLTFCGRLREGDAVDDALRAAYGLTVPNTAALETQWRRRALGDMAN